MCQQFWDSLYRRVHVSIYPHSKIYLHICYFLRFIALVFFSNLDDVYQGLLHAVACGLLPLMNINEPISVSSAENSTHRRRRRPASLS